LLNKLYEVFVCACALGAAVVQYMNKHEAKYTLLIVPHLLLFYSLF